MIRYAVRRAVWSLLVLVAVNGVTYLAIAYLAIRQHGEVRPATYGGARRLVRDPDAVSSVPVSEVLESYAEYAGSALHGDFGMVSRVDSVIGLLATALPRSLILLVLALVVATIGGVAIGYLSFDQKTKRANPAALIFNVLGYAMPAFYLGIVAMQGLFLFSRLTHRTDTILPAMGYGLDLHLVLPVLVLALRPMAEIARLTVELLAEELEKEYVRTAIAKGLPWRRVMLRHAFPNIATVIVIAIGNSTRYLLSSLIVVELLFGWPGVGKALAVAVAPRLDGRPSAPTLFAPSLVAALVTALAALALCVNYATGLTARSIDPRLRD